MTNIILITTEIILVACIYLEEHHFNTSSDLWFVFWSILLHNYISLIHKKLITEAWHRHKRIVTLVTLIIMNLYLKFSNITSGTQKLQQ